MKQSSKIQTSLEVISVKEVKGFMPRNSYDPNRYNGNRMVSRSCEAKALLIEGYSNGNLIKFYSPSVVITKTDGLLNYVSMPDNSWFKLEEHGSEVAHGAEMFNGGSTPNFAIGFKQTISPKIQTGDTIQISYAINNAGKINRVQVKK